jgi:hypothetical protein
MNELMNILTKSFQVLSTSKTDSSWNTRYIDRYNEEELLDKITKLEHRQDVSFECMGLTLIRDLCRSGDHAANCLFGFITKNFLCLEKHSRIRSFIAFTQFGFKIK